MPSFVMNAIGAQVAAISSGQAYSSSVNLEGLRLFALLMPSSWTSASVTFQASFDNGTTWSNMYDATGSEIVAVAGASRLVVLDPITFSSVPMVKLRSGTSSAEVVQGQDCVITVVSRAI